jgi:REP element-mobilizing transposase RayT
MNENKTIKKSSFSYDPATHHRRSIRLRGYDYSQKGYYFITICVHNHVPLFGHIDNGEMVLNDHGRIAYDEWVKTSDMRSNIDLHEFIVMPNHVHGIIVIGDARIDEVNQLDTCQSDTCQLGTRHCAPTGGQFGKSVSNSIPTIVRGYKSVVTKQINILRNTPAVPVWQRNYHEHVIRDEESYIKIFEYIKNNPKSWSMDCYHV